MLAVSGLAVKVKQSEAPTTSYTSYSSPSYSYSSYSYSTYDYASYGYSDADSYYTYYYYDSSPTYSYTYYYYVEPTTYSYSYDSYSDYYYYTPTYYYTSSYDYTDYSYSSASYYYGDSGSSAYGSTSTSDADTTVAATAHEALELPTPPAPVSLELTMEELLVELRECKKTLTIEEIRKELATCRELEYEQELLELASTWTGYYNQYDVDQEMTFEELFIGDTPKVIGEGDDVVEHFKLEGTRDGDEVVFKKRYPELDMYHIMYTGTLTDEDTVLHGDWQIFNGDNKSDVEGEHG